MHAPIRRAIRAIGISLNGTLQITEFHDVAYDTISNVVIGGAEDTGVSEETATGSTTWREVNSGNGGAVAVDDTTLASLNESYRYTASEDLAGFERQTVDANNNVLDTENPALMVTEAGADFYTVDGGQFVTPVVLNAVDPSRMVIGGSTSVFESFDRGETLTDLTLVPNAHAMVYGGYLDGVANPDVLWVVSDAGVYLRTSATGTLAKTGYTGGAARDIVVDPTDWQKAYVIDANNIYYTADGGGTWTNITHGDARLVGLQSVAVRRRGQCQLRPGGRLRMASSSRRAELPESGIGWAPTCPTLLSRAWSTTLRTTF